MRTVTEALAFLESQPNVGKYLADNGYEGPRLDAIRCPVAKYLQAQGFERVRVGGLSVSAKGQVSVVTPPRIRQFLRDFDGAGVAVVQQLYGFQAVL